MDRIDIYLLENDVLLVKQFPSNESYRIKDDLKKAKFFDNLSKERFSKIFYDKKCDVIILKHGSNEAHINGFSSFLGNDYFKTMFRKIQSCNKKKIHKNMTLVKSSIATGIVALGLGIGVVAANSINKNAHAIEQEKEDGEVLFLDEEEAYEYFDSVEKMTSLDLDVESVGNEKFNNIELVKTADIIEVEIQDNTACNYFDKSNFENYEDVIKFAANMYYVDYNDAKDAVNENMSYILGDKGEITMWMDSDLELDRIKDLKDRGLIEPDIVLTGIFITIKNYAYSHNTVSGDVIISDKTSSQKEQDIIDVARYIYGVTDNRLLANILAVHRLESNNGSSNLSITQNNHGGNRNSDLTFTSYKTSEIGAESMVRNFLKNYDRLFYRDDYNPDEPIEYGIGKSYCETPIEWGEVVYEKTNSILDNDELSKYVRDVAYKV